jgi:hypothetical protein
LTLPLHYQILLAARPILQDLFAALNSADHAHYLKFTIAKQFGLIGLQTTPFRELIFSTAAIRSRTKSYKEPNIFYPSIRALNGHSN